MFFATHISYWTLIDMAGKKEPKKENKREKKAADKEKAKKAKKSESAPKSK